MQDNICPAETVSAACDAIGSQDKHIYPYDGHGHDAGRAHHRAIVDEFVAHLAPPEAATMLREYAQLSPRVWTAMANAWRDADDAGVEFHLVTEQPEHPLQAARDQQATWKVAESRYAVTFTLSHMPSRHAAWYAPVRGAA